MNSNLFELIRQWGKEKGIIDRSYPEKQFLKLLEEVGELADALNKNDLDNIKDAIGDCIVVLTLLGAMLNINAEECLETVYDIISKRTGRMINGVFVKDDE